MRVTRNILLCVTAITLALYVLRCLLPADGSAHEVPPDRVCERHLKGIGKALLKYREEHGSFPPAVLCDSSGHKASWRLLLSSDVIHTCFNLSVLEQTKATDSLKGYHFDETWDSKNNLLWAENNRALELLWRVFFCPIEIEYDQENGLCPNAVRDIERGKDPFAARYITYLMLVRPDPDASLPDDAVIVVESLGCGVRVQEPRDIALDELLRAESPFGVGRLNSRHSNVVKALRADGKVIDIPKDIGKEELKKLLRGT
jgi:hypothetical protein